MEQLKHPCNALVITDNYLFAKEDLLQNHRQLDEKFIVFVVGTAVVTYQIEAQTPKKVRYSIFNRLNTGGMPLNAQEIRQALNQQAKRSSFFNRVC